MAAMVVEELGLCVDDANLSGGAQADFACAGSKGIPKRPRCGGSSRNAGEFANRAALGWRRQAVPAVGFQAPVFRHLIRHFRAREGEHIDFLNAPRAALE